MHPIRILSTSQMEMIDDAAQQILEKTGMIFQSADALAYLGKIGCRVDQSDGRVRFPRQLTAAYLEKMRRDYASPSRPDRMGVRYSHVRFRSTPHEVHQDFTVSAGGFVCFIDDLDGVRRPGNLHDVLCSINMVNNLPQIDLTGLPVSDQSIPAPQRPIRMAATLATYTRKLGGVEIFSRQDVRYMHEMALVVAGSEQNLRERPIMVGYGETRSPLCFDENMIDIYLEYIKLGMPQTIDCMPCGGTTAPMTAAGILAIGAAETIGAMILGYAVRDDAIVGLDINCSYADMSSGIFKYGGADRNNLLMARIQLLSEYYGCPAGVHGGKTNSCFYNEMAGVEKATSMLSAVMAGAVAFGTVGALENAITFSPVQLVMDNEIAAGVRRTIRSPLEVSEQTLAVDLIDQVGPGGNFLNEMHTAEHFREELLLSPLFPAQTWGTSHGQPDAYDAVLKANEIARQLWVEPAQPVLSDEQIRSIEKIVRNATT